jgi:iron complex outermembrane receptor protein
VTKTAPNYDITQLTATYASKSTFGTLVDVSRRFGEKKEWGFRFNGGYRNGNTAFDRQKDELGSAVLNLDYRGERVRMSADFGYQAEDLSPPLRFITLNSAPTFATIAVPAAPSAGTNYMPSWAQWKPKDTFAMVRGEADVTDNVTVYGAYGYHRSTIDYLYTSPRVTNANGTWIAAPFNGNDTYDVWSGDTGIRATVDTGPVNHLVTVNYSSTVREYSAYAKGASAVTGNIYSESTIPLPASFPLNAQALETMTRQSSVGVADVMSVMNKRLQLIVGARRQTVGTSSTNYLTPSSNNQVENSIWSPAYAVIVKPLENVSVYANYIEGLKAPEVVTGTATYSNVGAILPAYQTKQKEAGVKVDFGRVTTTLSVFEITNPNPISVPVAGFALPARQLSGEQRNRGVEFYVFGEVTPSVRVLGGITLIDGKVVNGASSSGTTVLNYDGKVPVGVSKVNVNIGAEWDTPFVRDLTLLGRVVYTGKSYANEANTQELPDWTRVDVGARYTVTSPWNGKPIVLRANIENLFNESYWNSYRTVSNALSLGAPRTYLASATFNF